MQKICQMKQLVSNIDFERIISVYKIVVGYEEKKEGERNKTDAGDSNLKSQSS